MRVNTNYSLGLCLFCLFFLLPPDNAVSSTTNKSSPSSYNDSFEKLRDDIWKRSGVLSLGKQIFQIPEIEIQDGRLLIQTKTGDFQRGGFTSRWTLKGDFDIQVDCHMDFLDGTAGMDQVLLFVARDKYKRYFTIVGLTKRSDNEPVVFAVFKGQCTIFPHKRKITRVINSQLHTIPRRQGYQVNFGVYTY